MHFVAAEEVLAQLNDQLNKRKTQVQDASDKLAQIQQAIADQVSTELPFCELRKKSFFSSVTLHTFSIFTGDHSCHVSFPEQIMNDEVPHAQRTVDIYLVKSN